MENKVSVIIPVYNVEEYLKKCVSSVCNQTYKNLEIILVDDGSPDKSGALCDKLAKKDSRIVVFHKKNGGVSSARNLGLEKVTGKYVTFVDSDDWLPQAAIADLVNGIENNKSDFCFGTGEFIGVTCNNTIQELKNETFSVDEINKLLEYHIILRSPWAKLYKTDIIKNHQIKFVEDIEFGEDRIFVWEYLKYCEKFTMIDKNVYFYSMLNVNNACGKYYEKYNIWLKKYTDTLWQAVKKCALSENEKVSLIKDFAFHEYVDVCKMYIPHLKDNRVEAVKKIAETTDIFSPYIFANNEKFTNEEYNEIYSDFVLTKNYDGLFDFFCAGQNSNDKKSYHDFLRNMILKVKKIFVYHL